MLIFPKIRALEYYEISHYFAAIKNKKKITRLKQKYSWIMSLYTCYGLMMAYNNIILSIILFYYALFNNKHNFI